MASAPIRIIIIGSRPGIHRRRHPVVLRVTFRRLGERYRVCDTRADC